MRDTSDGNCLDQHQHDAAMTATTSQGIAPNKCVIPPKPDTTQGRLVKTTASPKSVGTNCYGPGTVATLSESPE